MRATSPPAPLLPRRALLRLGAGRRAAGATARRALPRARAAASAGRVLALALLLLSSRRGTAAVIPRVSEAGCRRRRSAGRDNAGPPGRASLALASQGLLVGQAEPERQSASPDRA
ncbi:unnamed protein product [Prorocentrum cordatum]|uniref:Uncharacterized protein n=1 Tax=Prorocentrum cordatum TaxID=2364126 RepID=A0ABN9RSS3_9DINO|nr:unnamed protein product [Polarella glacialis]